MITMLLGWDKDGNVVATLDYQVQTLDGVVVGLIDFEAHESAGGRMRDVAEWDGAVGAGTWPEWLGGQAHAFKVELHPSPAPARARIAALVHRESGHRRVRADIEAAIQQRVSDEGGWATDIRDIVGGPGRPLQLDEQGQTLPKRVPTAPALPVIGVNRG